MIAEPVYCEWKECVKSVRTDPSLFPVPNDVKPTLSVLTGKR